MYSELAGLTKPNQYAGGFIRLAPSMQVRSAGKRRARRVLSMDANAGAVSRYLKPAQLAGLGRMTPEQEAAKKQLKQAWKAERQAIKAQYKGQGKKVLKTALRAAGASKRDWRQIAKAVKQASAAGVPAGDPLAPATPGSGGGVLLDPWYPPASTGSGGGGGGGAAPIDYGSGDGGGAEPAQGGGLLPLALAAAGVYFLS